MTALADTAFGPILSRVKVKKHEIRKPTSWSVGVKKATLVKFNLPDTEEGMRLIPRALRPGLDRDQRNEEANHLAYAAALGKTEKTVSDRVEGRAVDTADEKMETPKDGQASASLFWNLLHQEGFHFVAGEWFRKRNRDGSTALVVELRFVHRSREESEIEARKATGIVPTPFSFKLREELLKKLFRKRFYRCFCFSNSAHLDPTKTYNFVGVGVGNKPLYELWAEDGKVFFRRGA